MQRNDFNSQGYKLESQIRDAYGRVTYSQTCHDKYIDRLLRRDSCIKIWQIILSAITTSGFVVAIFSNEKIAAVLGAIISLVLLILNTYSKNANLVNTANEYKFASDMLWKIREEYVSLLTDFEMLSPGDIMRKRDDLQFRTYCVYKNGPRTDKRSYEETRKALKEEEEQTFADAEIDIMLPTAIRRGNRIMVTQKKENL